MSAFSESESELGSRERDAEMAEAGGDKQKVGGGCPRSARVLKSAEGFSRGLGGTRWAAATLEKC